MKFKSVIRKRNIEFLALTASQCEEMVDAYFKEGGNESFESRAFDLFLEYPQQNLHVEKFRSSCEELLMVHAASQGSGQDFWQLPEGRKALMALLAELRSA
jgi:hypothetical protein